MRVGITAAVVAFVVAAAIGVRWWTHPTVFGDVGDSISVGPLPVSEASLSTALTFPKVGGEPETVTISGAKAFFSENTAKATATFAICDRGPGEDPIGAVRDPGSCCQNVVPLIAGATFRYDPAPDSDYLIVTITPTRGGVATLALVELAYERGASHLFQRGTESIQVDRKVAATEG